MRQSSSIPGGGRTASATPARARASASATFDAKQTQTEALLRQAAAMGEGAVTQANSMGVEDMVITHMIRRLQLPISVFVLETGRLHTETLALLERTQALEGIQVRVYRPQARAVIHFIRTQGQDAVYNSVAQRRQCCDIRKMAPLARALAGKKAWITGLRREQSDARAAVPQVDTAEVAARGLTKFNPLADWTQGDVWHYVAQHGVDYNPLHDQFYPSIGCAPCTRAVTLGEDSRSGRWWWESESAKECGLHVKPHSLAEGQAAPQGDASALTSAQAHAAAGGVKGAAAPGRSQSNDAKECGLHVKTSTCDITLVEPQQHKEESPA